MPLWKVEWLIAKVKRQGDVGHLRKINVFDSRTGKYAILTFSRLRRKAQSIHIQMDSIVAISYLVKIGGTQNGSDCSEQGNVGLFVVQRDHNYCRISPKVTQCVGRYSFQDSKGCRQVKVKSQFIPKVCKYWETLEIDLFASRISNQPPSYISWKLDPYSQGKDAFQIFLINKMGYAFP